MKTQNEFLKNNSIPKQYRTKLSRNTQSFQQPIYSHLNWTVPTLQTINNNNDDSERFMIAKLINYLSDSPSKAH